MMKGEYYLKIEDEEQFEQAIDHLARGKFFEETDLHKVDNETVMTTSSSVNDSIMMYLAYKGIEFKNYQKPLFLYN